MKANIVAMNTYTKRHGDRLEISPQTVLAGPCAKGNCQWLPRRTVATVLARPLWTAEPLNTQERAVAKSASLALKVIRASATAQFSDDRPARFVTAFHLASVSQKAAAKSRSMRCVN